MPASVSFRIPSLLIGVYTNLLFAVYDLCYTLHCYVILPANCSVTTTKSFLLNICRHSLYCVHKVVLAIGLKSKFCLSTSFWQRHLCLRSKTEFKERHLNISSYTVLCRYRCSKELANIAYIFRWRHSQYCHFLLVHSLDYMSSHPVVRGNEN